MHVLVRRIGSERGPRSGAGFVNHFFPDAFGFEDEFDEFAGGAFAAIGFGGVVGGAGDFGGGVVHGDGQSNALHDGQVRQVVTKESDLRFLGAGLAQDVFVGRDFVALLFVDKLDVQFFAAATESWAGATGDDAGTQTGGAGGRGGVAGTGLKVFQVEAGCVGF